MKFVYFLILFLFLELTCVAHPLDDAVKSLEAETKQELNIDSFKNVQFLKNSTKEKIKFSDFTKNQKYLFVIWQMEILANRLSSYQQIIDKEKPDLSSKLLTIRKDYAVKSEKTIANFLQNCDLPQQEKIEFIRRIENWNKEQRLIER